MLNGRGSYGFHASLDRLFHRVATVLEHVGRPGEVKLETAELEMGHLVGRNDFEPGKVLRLVVVVVDHRRQVHLGAVGGRRILVHPSDLAADQFLGAEHLDVLAGQRAGVEAHDAFDPLQIQAGREGFQHGFRSVGLYFEERDTAFGIFAQQLDAVLIPLVQLGEGDAVQHRVQALQERRDRVGRAGEQAFTKVEDVALGAGGNVGQRLGAVVEEPRRVPEAHLGQFFAQPEEPSGLSFLNVLQGAGGHFQARLYLAPAAVGEGAGHGQESFPLPTHRREDVPAKDQAFGSYVVGLVGQRLN